MHWELSTREREENSCWTLFISPPQMTYGNVPGRVFMPPFQVLRSLPQKSSHNMRSTASEELKRVGIHTGMWIQRGRRGKLHPLKLAANGTSLTVEEDEASEVNEPALGKQVQAASSHLFVFLCTWKGLPEGLLCDFHGVWGEVTDQTAVPRSACFALLACRCSQRLHFSSHKQTSPTSKTFQRWQWPCTDISQFFSPSLDASHLVPGFCANPTDWAAPK